MVANDSEASNFSIAVVPVRGNLFRGGLVRLTERALDQTERVLDQREPKRGSTSPRKKLLTRSQSRSVRILGGSSLSASSK